tara:strand:+ start:26994 stop:28061 length:1068 start_codon:yes stop_codon:yes gene_type:complete
MNKILLFLAIILIFSCGQNQLDEEIEMIDPITINPLIDFESFYNQLPAKEKDCLVENFDNSNQLVSFIDEGSLPRSELANCLSMGTNFRILQGILINKTIQLSDSEKDCISSKNDEEYFDYLGEKFGSPMFTYSLGTLFCLNESSRKIFDSNSGENIFDDLIDNKALVSILPNNIDSIECLANKTGFNSTKDSLTYIYTSGGLFPLQIFSDISSISECIQIPKELVDLGLNNDSSICLSEKLQNAFSDPLNPSLTDLPQVILELEKCNIDAVALLRYFEFDIPDPEANNEEIEILEEVSTDDRFICLSEKLDMNDVLEFLYTGKLSNNALEVAESCDISKEEIESLDLSEILQNN